MIRSAVEIFCFLFLSKMFSRTIMPKPWGSGGCSPTMSAAKRIVLLGINWMFLIFLVKPPLSLIYDSLLCITSLRWRSKNYETFSVVILQFGTTGRPGTFDSLLCILGIKYLLPKFLVFLFMYKLFEFFVFIEFILVYQIQ